MVATYDAHALQLLLPHRHPFLFVDSITVVDPGRHVRGVKRVTSGDCARETVGGVPLTWPNLLVLEALAQAASAILAGLADGAAGTVGYFASMTNVRLREPARPGETLTLDVRLVRFRRGIARVLGVATVDDRFVARATFAVALRAARPEASVSPTT